jgi:nitroreductase
MAVCPVDAVSPRSDIAGSFPLVESPGDELTEVERLLQLKRSIRSFTDVPLEVEEIERILGYGEMAPSSHNFRTRRYSVVTSLERIQEMEKAVVGAIAPLRLVLNRAVLAFLARTSPDVARDLRSLRVALDKVVTHFRAGGAPIFRGAPCIICVSAAKRNGQGRDDCIATLQYMMLYAQSTGIASGTIGYAQHAHRHIERILQVPRSHAIYAVGIFGHPKHAYSRTLRYPAPPTDYF